MNVVLQTSGYYIVSSAARMSSKDNTWSWWISLGAFIIYFLSAGMIKGLGVMLPVLREQFTTQTWVIGMIISLVTGFGSVACKFLISMSYYVMRIAYIITTYFGSKID